MIINIKFLVLLSLLFIILQDNAILIGSQLIYTAPILIIILLFIFALIKFKDLNRIINFAYKKTPFKYLIWFLIYLLLTSFFHGDSTTTIKILRRIFLIITLIIIPVLMYALIFVPRFISFFKVFKVFVHTTFWILLYGVIDYTFRIVFHTKPPLYNILCSRNYYNTIRYESFNGSSEILERACSIFFEPSFFATFIFLFLPMIYVLLKSKIKILNNSMLNLTLKLLLLILAWTCLFLTKSPIYIIFSIIYTFLFFFNDILKMLKKYPLKVFLSLLLLCFSFSLISTTKNPIMYRMQKIVSSLGRIESLIIADTSFATRILATENTFMAFKSVPLLGCGYGNGNDIMYKQYRKTKTPLTEEIITKQMLINKEAPSPNIFWSMLLQTGIIGTALLFTFFIKSILVALKIQKYFVAKENIFVKILILIAINYIIISFYWSIDTYPMMWFIFGLLNSYILHSRLKILMNRNSEVNQCQNFQ